MSGQQGFAANSDSSTRQPFLSAPVKDCYFRIAPTLVRMVLKRKVALWEAKPSTTVVAV